MKMLKLKRKNITGVYAVAIAALSVFGGCVNESLDPCPEKKTTLRFVYDYNMERANAFHQQVHCLSVLIYDEEGKFVTRQTETSEDVLADENYRMTVDLPAGRYHAVAYGGMECEESSFAFTVLPQNGSLLSDLGVRLDPGALTDDSRRLLHNHFHGAADFTVKSDASSETRVEMMRNTNSIHVALQNAYGSPISHEDFEFSITDDNTLFTHDNTLVPAGEVTYLPYLSETITAEEDGNEELDTKADGDEEGEDAPVSIATAHFTTSRIVQAKATKPILSVKRRSDGHEVFSIPLASYMLLFKENHDRTAPMGNQEYLDRENTWNFVFFLDDHNGGTWIKSQIIVNDWLVRINGTEF